MRDKRSGLESRTPIPPPGSAMKLMPSRSSAPEVLNLLSSTESQMEDDDGFRWGTICGDCGDDEFPSLFQRVAGPSSGRQSGLSSAGSPAPDPSGGSCGGGGVHRHRAVWRAQDRTAATVSALCERHALA